MVIRNRPQGVIQRSRGPAPISAQPTENNRNTMRPIRVRLTQPLSALESLSLASHPRYVAKQHSLFVIWPSLIFCKLHHILNLRHIRPPRSGITISAATRHHVATITPERRNLRYPRSSDRGERITYFLPSERRTLS